MRLLSLASVLALTVLPHVAAAPIASVGVLDMSAEWHAPSFFGRCQHSPALVAYEHVNSRVLLSVHSTHEVATDGTAPRTETECAISFAIEPGVTVNPCDMPLGNPSPASTTNDPYLYPSPYGYWTKIVNFPNGGYVELVLDETFGSSAAFYGWCRSGSISASFGATFQPVSAG